MYAYGPGFIVSLTIPASVMAAKLGCSIDVRLAGLPSPRGPASTIVTKVVFADDRSINITPCSE